MVWNYSINDSPLAREASERSAEPHPPQGALSVYDMAQDAMEPRRAIDDSAALTEEARKIGRAIPEQFAELIKNPSLHAEQILSLVKELVELNQKPDITETDIQSASPAIREAALAIKEKQEAIAAQEKEMAGVVLAPMAALTAAVMPRSDHEQGTQPYGVTCGRLAVLDLGMNDAAALDRVFDAGPAQTPNTPQRQQDLGRV